MATAVEGKWKNFVCRIATQEDLPVMLAHLRESFYLDEPLCRLVGYDEVRGKELDENIQSLLSDGMTLLLFEKGTYKLAAIQVNHNDFPETIHPYPPPRTRKTEIELKFLLHLKKGINIFNIYNIPVLADLTYTSVSREFRGMGITRELYKRTIQLFKNKGFNLVTAIFSTEYTRKVGRDVGFVEIKREYYNKFIDEKGLCLFPNIPHPEEYATYDVLQL